MKKIILNFIFTLILAVPFKMSALLNVGIGKAEITPPIGTPSAGYMQRKGEGMQGVHDPLLALALFIDNGEKKIVFCSVDHLGFNSEMVQEITRKVRSFPGLEECEIYIGSSHTHSGGGAYLNIPFLGEHLAGAYNAQIVKLYIEKTAAAIVRSSQNPVPAKIGIGYGHAGNLSQYRGQWPVEMTPLTDIAVVKITKLDHTPLAVLFNYPVHPTVLKSDNLLFSADFVGYARTHLQALLGPNIQPIYFNGAQGDINPVVIDEESRFDSCAYLGKSLAASVEEIWRSIEAKESLHIDMQKEAYSFHPQPTPFGLDLSVAHYDSEINLLVLNHLHAFITIPGELSSLYDQRLKQAGSLLGYRHVSILGLTNDAHGYIILPESWRHKTFEASLSFGGENYGEVTECRAQALLKNLAPAR